MASRCPAKWIIITDIWNLYLWGTRPFQRHSSTWSQALNKYTSPVNGAAVRCWNFPPSSFSNTPPHIIILPYTIQLPPPATLIVWFYFNSPFHFTPGAMSINFNLHPLECQVLFLGMKIIIIITRGALSEDIKVLTKTVPTASWIEMGCDVSVRGREICA